VRLGLDARGAANGAADAARRVLRDAGTST
jgi:hypothetical protein